MHVLQRCRGERGMLVSVFSPALIHTTTNKMHNKSAPVSALCLISTHFLSFPALHFLQVSRGIRREKNIVDVSVVDDCREFWDLELNNGKHEEIDKEEAFVIVL